MNDSQILHATTVALDGHALLIKGGSGSGKSSLALRMIALGASLVADDRTMISQKGGQIIADCPPQIKGMIEARGVGLLHCPPAPPTAIKLVLDMDHTETERLPQKRNTMLFSVSLPLLYLSNTPHFTAALLIHLQHGCVT